MTGLLLALVAGLAFALFDRPALLHARLSAASPARHSAVLAGWAFLIVAHVALSATAGWLLHGLLGPRPRAMFLGLALLLGGIGLFMARGALPLPGWAGRRPALALLAGAGPAMLGDKVQFLIVAIAAWTGNPVAVAAGGAIALLVAGEARRMATGVVPDRTLALARHGVAGLASVAGAIVVLAAMRLIG